MSLLVFSLLLFLTTCQQSLAEESSASSESGEVDYDILFEECEPYFEDLVKTLTEMIENGKVSPCCYDVLKMLNTSIESSGESLEVLAEILAMEMLNISVECFEISDEDQEDYEIELCYEMDEKSKLKMKECLKKMSVDVEKKVTVQRTPKCQELLDQFENIGDEMKKRRK